jgi:hypothetical protein
MLTRLVANPEAKRMTVHTSNNFRAGLKPCRFQIVLILW